MRCLNCMNEFDEAYGVCPYCGYIPGSPPKEADHLYPGTILKDRYIIGTTIGFGGFGITYRAWDTVLQKKVAIKENYPQGFVRRIPGEKTVIVNSANAQAGYEQRKGRFLAEARSLALFDNHPNVVKVYEFFEENNTAYIVMEYLEGMSYRDFLKAAGGKVDYTTAVSVILSVLDALRELHKAGILHRDISPDNIFMVPIEEDPGRYQVKLIDFGAARLPNVEDEEIELKPGYAPPEQYTRDGKQGPWTDIYAVGATLYRSITGLVPEESVNRLVEDDLTPPDQLIPELPKFINDSILRAMALKQELRFQNVDQFSEALCEKKKVLDVDSELKRRKQIRFVGIGAIAVAVCAALGICAGLYMNRRNSLTDITAAITFEMPDWNTYNTEEIIAAGVTGAENGDTDQKQLDIESTSDMMDRILSDYQSRFEKVSVTQDAFTDVDEYRDYLIEKAGENDLPSVLDTSVITPADTGVWDKLGTLDTTYDTLNTGSYYFMKDAGFQQYFADEKKQIPISFRAPVLYVNTNLISDEDTLEDLRHLRSTADLKDGSGKVSFCVSSDALDMYRETFAAADDVDSMKEFQDPAKDEPGYLPFLNRETAYYLGTTDDYEVVRASLGGIYRLVVLTDLQSEGKVKGEFTHLYSISGSLEGDDKQAADNLVYYLLSENAQDIFNLQDGNGLSLNRNMLETYVKSNSEFEEVARYLDTLQMRYGE